jgi:hypothetical protein
MKKSFDAVAANKDSDDGKMKPLNDLLGEITGDRWEFLPPDEEFKRARIAFLLGHPEDYNRFLSYKDVIKKYPTVFRDDIYQAHYLGGDVLAVITNIGNGYASITIDAEDTPETSEALACLSEKFIRFKRIDFPAYHQWKTAVYGAEFIV